MFNSGNFKIPSENSNCSRFKLYFSNAFYPQCTETSFGTNSSQPDKRNKWNSDLGWEDLSISLIIPAEGSTFLASHSLNSSNFKSTVPIRVQPSFGNSRSRIPQKRLITRLLDCVDLTKRLDSAPEITMPFYFWWKQSDQPHSFSHLSLPFI